MKLGTGERFSKKDSKASKIQVGTDIIYHLVGDMCLHRALLSTWHCTILGQLKVLAIDVQ